MKLVIALIMLFVGSCSIMLNLDKPMSWNKDIPEECATMNAHQLEFYQRLCTGKDING